MKIQQIRNATIIIEYAGKRFLVAPVLDEKGWGVCSFSVLSPSGAEKPATRPAHEGRRNCQQHRLRAT